MKIALFYLILLLITLSFSCTKPECEEHEMPLTNISFIKKNGTTGANESFPLAGFKVYGVEKEDSLLYNVNDTTLISSISIPLSLLADSCQYVLLIGNIYDTLTFYYERKSELISVECGFNVEFIIDTVLTTKNSISELELVNGNISSKNENNFKLHFD